MLHLTLPIQCLIKILADLKALLHIPQPSPSFTSNVSAPSLTRHGLQPHLVDGQAFPRVGWGDLVQDGSPCHGPQELGHHVEDCTQEGDVGADEASHRHRRVDVGSADVPQGLDQRANGQAKSQCSLKDARGGS